MFDIWSDSSNVQSIYHWLFFIWPNYNDIKNGKLWWSRSHWNRTSTTWNDQISPGSRLRRCWMMTTTPGYRSINHCVSRLRGGRGSGRHWRRFWIFHQLSGLTLLMYFLTLSSWFTIWRLWGLLRGSGTGSKVVQHSIVCMHHLHPTGISRHTYTVW